MTTPPHIEAIARAVFPKPFSDWQEMYNRAVKTFTEEGAKEVADHHCGPAIRVAIADATLAFTMSAEICGKEIATLRELLNKQNVAIDISNEVAIYQICEAAISALIPKEG